MQIKYQSYQKTVEHKSWPFFGNSKHTDLSHSNPNKEYEIWISDIYMKQQMSVSGN